ncbi:MAG: rubredoxin [Motiliproteus sp.]
MSQNYQCDICDYHYEAAVGCPDEGVTPGTSWQDIPDEWVCPECGAPKKLFSQIANPTG